MTNSSLIGPPRQVFPKASCHLPSIVVETMDGGEVESGELRWPPGDVSSDITEEYTQVTGKVIAHVTGLSCLSSPL